MTDEEFDAPSITAQPPTGWPRASISESRIGWTLDYKFLEKVERLAKSRTEFSTSMEATEQVLIAALEVLAADPKAAPALTGDLAEPRYDSDRIYDRPVGYLPAYELSRLHSGHGAQLRSAKFGPSALDGDVPVYLGSSALALVQALIGAQRAINSMKVEAETAAQGDEQMMLDACEQISNEGLEASLAIQAALSTAAQPPAAPQEELREGASYESMNLAVMVLSDCGHSSNYTPLLERVAGRIDRHVERLLIAQRADLTRRAQAEPAQPPADGAMNTIAAMFHSGEEIEGPDGLAMMVDMALWDDALDAFDKIIGEELE